MVVNIVQADAIGAGRGTTEDPPNFHCQNLQRFRVRRHHLSVVRICGRPLIGAYAGCLEKLSLGASSWLPRKKFE